MILSKDGQVITLDNENHAEAFLLNGWAEVKSPATSESLKVAEVMPEPEKVEAEAEAIPEEVKPEEVKKSLRGRKKQEK